YGIFKDYTVPKLESVFGTAGCLHEMIVSGMTNLQIVEEALRGEGMTREEISARKDERRSCYIAEMKRATGNGAHVIEAMRGGRNWPHSFRRRSSRVRSRRAATQSA